MTAAISSEQEFLYFTARWRRQTRFTDFV